MQAQMTWGERLAGSLAELGALAASWWTTVKSFTAPERLLLAALLCFGAVGAQSTYAVVTAARGPLAGGLAAGGNELLYIGAAGFAAATLAHRLIAWSLMGAGAGVSAYFGALVSLKTEVPRLFGEPIVWPTRDEWIIRGVPAIVEGIAPALFALLLSILLHASASHRLDEDRRRRQDIRHRQELKPFACPFCDYANDTPGKLWGHFGRCPAGASDPRTPEDKRAIVKLAVAEGHKRLLEG